MAAPALLHQSRRECPKKAMNDNFRELLGAWVAVALYLGTIGLLASMLFLLLGD
jgi:hypothetical protein